MTELWKQLSKSFGPQWLLFSFMPSFVFWFLAFLEWGLVHPQFLHLLEKPPTHLITSFSIDVILTAWVLSLLSKPTLMLFEGYLLPKKLKELLLKRMIRKFNELHKEMETLRNRLKTEIADLSETERLVLTERFHQLDAVLIYHFPSRVEKLMPTMFGNIMRAAEDYARKRYGLDPIVLWEHLFMKLPSETKSLLSTNFNETMLMLRMCILVAILAVEWIVLTIDKTVFLGEWLALVEGVVGSAALIGVSYMFYKISLVSLANFAKTLRATFDIHRHELLRSFGFEPPKSVEEERKIWKSIVKFVHRGGLLKVKDERDKQA